MTSISFSFGRKRLHSPDFRDSSDSESEDEAPPVKSKKRDPANKIPAAFASRLRNLVVWISGLPVKDYFTMAVKAGSTIPVEEIEVDEEEVITIEEEEDDGEEKPNPLLQRFQQSQRQLVAKMARETNGSCTTRLRTLGNEVSCMYDSRFDDHKPIQGDMRQNTNGSYSLRGVESNRGSTVISNPASDFEILLDTKSTPEPDLEIISDTPNNFQNCRMNRASTRTSTIRSSTPLTGPSSQRPSRSQSASAPYTAHEVVRLQEKEQYQLLLQKYIHGNNYNYVNKKSKPDRADAARGTEVSMNHFKKEILQQPVSTFLEKYCRPCQLVQPPPKQSKQKQPIEVILDDDDEMEIVDIKLPKHKPRYPSDDFFSPDWLRELKNSVKTQTAERMRILQEREKQLERIKKERLLEQLKIEEPSEPEFPELTKEMEEMVDKALTGDPEERLVKDIHRKDVDTLSGLSWLNDLVINSYFDLIVERSHQEDYPSVHAFNTYFYTNYKQNGYSNVRRWTRKIDLFNIDLIFVPIHLGVHWCLGVIDNRSKRICYYDSMGSGEEKSLDLLHEYLRLEHKDKKGVSLDSSTYTTEVMKDIPQQMNGSDCGMFTLKYAEYISRNAEITFSQKDMHYFRRRMVYELLTRKLL